MSKQSDAIEKDLLAALNRDGAIPDSLAYAAAAGVDHERLVGVMLSLSGDRFIVMTPKTKSGLGLTDDGQLYLDGGSPECRVFAAIPAEGSIARTEVQAAVGKAMFGVGWGQCMKQRWIKFDKATKTVSRAKVGCLCVVRVLCVLCVWLVCGVCGVRTG